jgi:N4-gp56 family major capsid protein
MANEITSTSTSTDQEKMVASELIKRSTLKLVAASVCDKIKQKKGTGKIAYFIRYKRMFVPVTTLTEGTDPANSTFELDSQTVTLDQWGDILTITDVAELTTLHPLMQQALELLADNAQRVIDREVQIVWFTGTNIQYGDSSVTSRRTITTSMKVTDTIIHRARVTLVDTGVQPRFGPLKSNASVVNVASANGPAGINGPNHYLAICGPQIMADVQQAGTSLGTWASVMMYAKQVNLYNAEVGTWLGFRWVETNFIPKITLLGNNTAAVVSTNAFGTDTPVVTAVDGGGTLTSATTYFFKVTRKDKLRGFEEAISIAHSMQSTATANNESFTFNFSALTAGYLYNLYFDSVQAGGTGTDATLKLVSENIAVGTTVTVTAVGTGVTAPDNVIGTGNTVHPIYFHGKESCFWVGLQNLSTHMTKPGSIIGNVLELKRAIGYKFMHKAMIPDQTRLLRVELASTF